MKLRIRFGSRRELLDFSQEPTTARVQDLQAAVSQLLGLELTSFALSLNGSAILGEDPDVLIAELGIVGGDLIHVILNDTSESPGAPSPNQTRSHEAAVAGPSGITSEDPKNKLDESSKSTDKRARNVDNESSSFSSSNENMSSSKHKKINYSKPSSGSAQASSSENPTSSEKAVFRQAALLCRDGISYLLKLTYEQSGVSTLHEAVCIAVHVLMLETGFTLSTNTDQASSCQDEPQQFIGREWRTKRGAEFHYTHPACPGASCDLVCTSLGPYVLIHGVTSGNELHQCQISAAEYVRGNVDLKSHGAVDVFHNLGRLSRMIKDNIAYPLVSSMRHELDLPELYGFMALPSEVKIMVLSMLPVRSILDMSSLCRELHSVANDNTLWHHLCFRDFGKGIRSSVTDWKAEYIRVYKELQALRHCDSAFVIPDWMAGSFTPVTPSPFGEYGPPGIIGGRSDLYPNIPFMPGGFPPPGHLPGPGRTPHPRFDPFGPIPDMEHFPGRPGRGRGRGRGRGGFPPGSMF